jgi:nucleotide-binding universal stress UspA family protein
VPYERTHRILVVTDRTAASPELLHAISERAARDLVQFRVVVTNPAAAELHLLHPERHAKAAEAEAVLRDVLPLIESAAGADVIGSVSVRHDPMDAVEETINNEPIDEIMVCVAPHGLSRLLQRGLPQRLKHLGLPVSSVQQAAKG